VKKKNIEKIGDEVCFNEPKYSPLLSRRRERQL
jgi:hypothetical protein